MSSYLQGAKDAVMGALGYETSGQQDEQNASDQKMAANQVDSSAASDGYASKDSQGQKGFRTEDGDVPENQKKELRPHVPSMLRRPETGTGTGLGGAPSVLDVPGHMVKHKLESTAQSLEGHAESKTEESEKSRD